MINSCGACLGDLKLEILPETYGAAGAAVNSIRIEQYCTRCGSLMMTPRLIELNVDLRVATQNILMEMYG